MAVGGRPPHRPSPLRPSPSSKIFLSFLLTLLFVAAVTVLLTSPSSLLPYVSSTFLAIHSDPVSAHLHLVHKHASDHLALLNAYSSFARKLKLDHSRLLSSFLHLSSNFSSFLSRLDSVDPSDDDSLRSLEKDLKDKIKLARLLVSDSKEAFDTHLKIQKLKDTIFAVHEQLHRATTAGALSSSIAAGSTPKSLHCLAMRLVDERLSNPQPYLRRDSDPRVLEDPELFHYTIFSDNVLAVSVVVNSVVRNAASPKKHVFHVVTDGMNLAAFQVWFVKKPPPFGVRVEIRSVDEFEFLNSSYSPIVRLIAEGRADLSVLDHLRFYLPEMFPRLRRIVYLEDDVVVQRDLEGLWRTDLDGRVNGAVEMCFGPFKRYSRYLNFSSPVVRDRFNPKACAWGFGVNVFDLDAWRREKLTEEYHKYMNLNTDGSLWSLDTTLPAGLMTFYSSTKPLEKTWHVMGLGYNPSISPNEISSAAVIHYNGNMKPWLDIAMNQYKNLWTKYVDSDMEYLQLCNFGV